MQGKDDEALGEFLAAAQLNPGDPRTRYKGGNIHVSRGRFVDAVREYRVALKLRPDYPDARHNLAVAEQALTRKE